MGLACVAIGSYLDSSGQFRALLVTGSGAAWGATRAALSSGAAYPLDSLDGGDDEMRSLRVDSDVPAEQHAADDLLGVPGRVPRVGGYVSSPP